MSKFLRSLLLSGLMLVAGGAASAATDKPWDIDETLGKADAPVTVIEYSSLTCPHCAHFQAEVFPEFKKEYVDTGKVKFIMRDFVWDAMAEAAAMIAHCSGERYFVFVDTFYHSQNNWLRAEKPFDALKKVANLGGMTNDMIDKCLDDKALLNKIMARKEDAETRYGIDSTPTFVINGKPYNNVGDFETLSKAVKEQTH